MFGLFNKERGSSGTAERGVRHSRGWGEVRKLLHEENGLRVLDFGATSPANINYLTTLGHSVYMSNVVQDAARAEWLKPLPEDAKKGEKPEFDVEAFVAANLDFSGRDFDVILLWDTASYLPPAVVPALFSRLYKVARPNCRLLAFFHGHLEGPDTVFSRHQLTESDDLQVLESGNFPVLHVYQMRSIEKLLEGFQSTKFYLGKDNVREVLAIR
jgi:hypothetical protein